MNKSRRNQLATIGAQMAELKSRIETLKDETNSVLNDEQDAFDNMPESLQCGEKGDKAQASIDAMGEMISAFEDMESAFDSIESNIETASE